METKTSLLKTKIKSRLAMLNLTFSEFCKKRDVSEPTMNSYLKDPKQAKVSVNWWEATGKLLKIPKTYKFKTNQMTRIDWFFSDIEDIHIGLIKNRSEK